MILRMLIVKIYRKISVSDKILKDIAYEIALTPKFDGHKWGLPSVVYKFFDKIQN